MAEPKGPVGHSSHYILRVSEEEKEKGAERLSEELMA